MEAYFFQNDLFHLEALLKQADECSSIDRLENARILHNKARTFTLKGQIGSGVEYTNKALQVFAEEYSTWDTAWTLIALGTTLAQKGQLEEGLDALLRAISLFREFGDSRWLIEASNYAGMFIAMFSGLKNEGLKFIEDAIRINNESKMLISWCLIYREHA